MAHKVYGTNDIEPPDYNFSEICPHCDGEIAVKLEDGNYRDYTVICPDCGKEMMLCTLCHWDYGDICDWCETGCILSRAEKGLCPYPPLVESNN